MSERQPGTGKFYSVLGFADFRRLWTGQIISNAGDSFTMIAQLVLVNRITGSTLALAGMAIALTLPTLFFGLLAGVFVDRLDRRRLMIGADLLRAGLVLPMTLVQRPDQIWIFYVCGFAMSTVATLFDPAKNALLPSLVPESELVRANALSQLTRILAMLVGPMLAGFILEWTAPPVAFIADGVSFAVSALSIALIGTRALARESRVVTAGLSAAVRGIVAEAGEGLRAVFGTRAVLALALVFAVAMLGLGAINVLVVAYLSRRFDVGPGSLGIIMAAQAVGMIVGTVLTGQWLGAARPGRVIGGALAVLGLGIIALAFAPTLPVVVGLAVVIGLADGPLNTVAATLMQTAVPDAQRGRVGAGMNTVIVVANLLSMTLAGLAGDAIGVTTVFVVGGAITVGAAGVAAVLLSGTPALAAPPAALGAEI